MQFSNLEIYLLPKNIWDLYYNIFMAVIIALL